MPALSKSKLMGLRQCPRRLWLDVHAPERRLDSDFSLTQFAVGDLVGDLARAVYDPEGVGILIDVMAEGPERAIEQTALAMDRRVPIFEAGFEGAGARAFVDVLLPSRKGSTRSWDLIEVKSSTQPKAAHRDDVAIQAYVLRHAGVQLGRVKLALVNKGFIYRGQDCYDGLLRELDITDEVLKREDEVARWVAKGEAIALDPSPPQVMTGIQCRTPYPCGYAQWCKAEDPKVLFPIEWLPNLQGSLRDYLVTQGIRDMREIPEAMLTSLQRRIRDCTVHQAVYQDETLLPALLQSIAHPVSYLDFETVQLPIPIWVGTRPYQTIPFQWSLHCDDLSGQLEDKSYLDLSGEDPSLGFAESLLQAIPSTGTVLVWNAHVEKSVLDSLAKRYPLHAMGLRQLSSRIVDLAEIVEKSFYHPLQRGSYKLKRVLPALAPELDYAELEGVQDGYMALRAYIEAIQAETPPERKLAIEEQLKRYCHRDSLALKTIHQALLSTLR